MIEAEKYYNVFICPNRTNDSGRVYRSLIPNGFSKEDFIERPAAFTLPPWIVRNTKLLINSDRFRRKVEGGEAGRQTQGEASILSSGSF